MIYVIFPVGSLFNRISFHIQGSSTYYGRITGLGIIHIPRMMNGQAPNLMSQRELPLNDSNI